MNGISLFAGIGGIDLGLREAAGIRTVCYVEKDPYCQEVLKKRMQEGWLDDAPIWGDICSFDGRRWAGRVDIVFGGFPCQDISVAGKGAGIKQGTRSGLWFEMLRVVSEIRPCFVFVENVPMLLNRGIDVVLGGLAEAGYDARWTTLRASDVGARHRRERWFCLAYLPTEDEQAGCGRLGGAGEICQNRETMADSPCGMPRQPTQWERGQDTGRRSPEKPAYPFGNRAKWDKSKHGTGRGAIQNSQELSYSSEQGLQGQEPEGEPGLPAECLRDFDTDPADLDPSSESFVGRVAHGIPKRVDRLKCLGNAVVPRQAAEAWRGLTADLAYSELC